MKSTQMRVQSVVHLVGHAATIAAFIIVCAITFGLI